MKCYLYRKWSVVVPNDFLEQLNCREFLSLCLYYTVQFNRHLLNHNASVLQLGGKNERYSFLKTVINGKRNITSREFWVFPVIIGNFTSKCMLFAQLSSQLLWWNRTAWLVISPVIAPRQSIGIITYATSMVIAIMCE